MRNLAHIALAGACTIAYSLTAQAAPPDHGPPPFPLQVGGDKGPGALPMGCTEDRYEPDSQTSPQPLSAGALSDLALCGGNDDYWRVDLQPGMLMRLHIDFSHAAGDVDMSLHRMSDFAQIDISEGVNDSEEIVYTATANESLIARVYGYGGVTNRYNLSLEMEDFSRGCAGDAFESNDSATSAPMAPTSPSEARICIGDEDWYAIDLAAGEGFDFGASFDPQMSSLSLGLYAPGRTTPLQQVRPSGTSALLVLDQSESGGRYYVRVSAPEGGYNRYDFSVARYTPGTSLSGTVSGQIQYEDELRGRDVVIGAPSTRWMAARDIPVELVRSSDNRAIAQTYTDNSGRYTMPFVHRASGDVFVRASARLEGPGYTMRVVQHEHSGLVHAAQSAVLAQLPRDTEGDYTADFRFAADGPLGGAFNITDRSLDAFRFIDRYATMRDLDLTIVWQRGRPHPCTSCFDTDTIYLGGGFDDPDEYDDSVILHEFGHFFIHFMSQDDSPGGHHNGDRTNPLVAYGEGIATVFAMAVEDSPIYVDTMTSGGLYQDFEVANWPEARGTGNGTIHGQVSEYLVVAIIWDLMDDRSEAHDAVAGGYESMMRVLTDYMPTCQTRNRGVAGADLADFVAGFRELYPHYASDLERILARHEFPSGALVQASPGGPK